jgi:hypothetical protein
MNFFSQHRSAWSEVYLTIWRALNSFICVRYKGYVPKLRRSKKRCNFHKYFTANGSNMGRWGAFHASFREIQYGFLEELCPPLGGGWLIQAGPVEYTNWVPKLAYAWLLLFGPPFPSPAFRSLLTYLAKIFRFSIFSLLPTSICFLGIIPPA